MRYKETGVDIQGSGQVKNAIKKLAGKTRNRNVLAGVGLFGGLYDLGNGMVLVVSIDGAGTKIELARQLGKLQSIGTDIVNHCINDILCMGAKPLFFLDYIAQDQLRSQEVIQLVEGMTSACLKAGLPLIGGELAQMPDIYSEGKSDAVGMITGLVEKKRIIDGGKIKPGDRIIGLPSVGPHTNGYSLIRKIFPQPQSHLLSPHRSYLRPVSFLLAEGFDIRGIAHITGGGLSGNIVRILPKNCQAQIRLDSWPILPIFQYIQRKGNVPAKEMRQVFNMGIGMVLIVPREIATAACHSLWYKHKELCYFIGEIILGRKGVKFI